VTPPTTAKTIATNIDALVKKMKPGSLVSLFPACVEVLAADCSTDTHVAPSHHHLPSGLY
jgi:hypothetical protein